MSAGALEAGGSLYQGESNAGVSDYNAQVATNNAAIVEGQGAEEAQQSLVQSRKMIGSGAAAYGASGAAAGGSAQWVLRAGAQQGALAALTLQNNADIKSTAYENESALDEYKAANDITTGQVEAFSDIVSSAGGGGGGGGSSSGDVSAEGSSTASMSEIAEVG